MVGISVIHCVGSFENFLESGPSTKVTLCGAVPCAIVDSGVSLPVMKIGTIWS